MAQDAFLIVFFLPKIRFVKKLLWGKWRVSLSGRNTFLAGFVWFLFKILFFFYYFIKTKRVLSFCCVLVSRIFFCLWTKIINANAKATTDGRKVIPAEFKSVFSSSFHWSRSIAHRKCFWVLVTPCCCKLRLYLSLCDAICPVSMAGPPTPWKCDFWAAQAILILIFKKKNFQFFFTQKMFFNELWVKHKARHNAAKHSSLLCRFWKFDLNHTGMSVWQKSSCSCSQHWRLSKVDSKVPNVSCNANSNPT